MTSTTAFNRMRGEQLQAPGSKGSSKLYLLLLCLLVCGTRLPLLGLGEADSALFVIGARQWLQHGPDGLMIYSAQVCATYYAFVLGLLKLLHLGPASLPKLMAAISFLACLGTVLLGYDLGSKLMNRQAAFYGMLLFALSPGLWWTSIEPHPQIPSLFFAVLSLWCLARYLKTSAHPLFSEHPPSASA